MRRISFDSKTFPLFLLLLCILSFGILIPSLGFYWDDWPMAWFAHTVGPTGFFNVFEGDRPFLAGIYLITTALLDPEPYQWQILGVFSRWLTTLAVWWTISLLWPGNPKRAAWIAALFAVFPGFKQQPISFVYSNGFFLLSSYIASLGLNILALRKPKKYWHLTVPALVSYAICTFSTEYYLGLDLLRGLILWLVLSETIENKRRRFVQTIRHWLPYLILLSIFLIWRVAIFQFPTYKPQLLDAIPPSPLSAIAALIYRIAFDSFKMGWLAWITPFRFPILDTFKALSTAGFWMLVLASFCVIFFYFKHYLKNKKNVEPLTGDGVKPPTVILTGLFGLVVAGWPFWIAGLPIELQFPYDRFGLAFMLGSSIFIAGLIEWILRTSTQKMIALALLLSMAIGSNFETSISFRRDWSTLKDMFWQLSWRAPGLEPGTLLLTYGLPFQYYSDNSLTAPINWMYAPQNRSLEIPYYLAFTDVRLKGSIPSFEEGQEVIQGYRSAVFKSSTSQALVFFYSPPGCLWVMDPERDKDLPVFPSEIYEPLNISHLSQVIPNPNPIARPPETIFGQEPDHNWCYYFEKAELSRQQNNWQGIVQLADAAFDRQLYTKQAEELLVFIEGYARTGDWQRALELSNLAYETSKQVETSLCKLLHTVNQENPPDPISQVNLRLTLAGFGCPLQ